MPAQGGITGSSPVPYREEGTMPSTTCTIDGDQRDGLYELVRNHLGSRLLLALAEHRLP